jgi:hypothetical protein
MLLANQNDELKNKLNKLVLEQKLERNKKYSENNLLVENPVIRDLDEEI